MSLVLVRTNRFFFLSSFHFSRAVVPLPDLTKATTEEGSQDDGDVVAVMAKDGTSSSPPTTVVPVGLVVAATVAVLGTVALL